MGRLQKILDNCLQYGTSTNEVLSAQYTSLTFTQRITDAGIALSRKGPALDNAFTKRFWRTLKYEEL